jgi:hypothetical protein
LTTKMLIDEVNKHQDKRDFIWWLSKNDFTSWSFRWIFDDPAATIALRADDEILENVC